MSIENLKSIIDNQLLTEQQKIATLEAAILQLKSILSFQSRQEVSACLESLGFQSIP